MKYVIDDTVAEKIGLTVPEVLALMIIHSKEDFRCIIAGLIDKGVLIKIGTPPNRFMITENFEKLYNNIILPSTTNVPNKKDISTLAEKLISIFPEGIKPGTTLYWKGSTKNIEEKLESFFKKYGTKYTEEQIVNATREYVSSFNGDFRLMRVLKYFIWKREDGQYISDLAEYLDNAGQTNETNNDWIAEVK